MDVFFNASVPGTVGKEKADARRDPPCAGVVVMVAVDVVAAAAEDEEGSVADDEGKAGIGSCV